MDHPLTSDRPPIRQAFIVLLLAFLGLVAQGPVDLPVHADTARDRVDAIRDLSAEPARLRGAMGSGANGVQGGAWPLHIEGLRSLGVQFRGIQVLSLFAAALAVLAVFLGAARVWGTESAWIAAVIAALAVGLPPNAFRVQWNPTLIPLPSAILALSVLGAARSGHWIHYPTAALSLSLINSMHISTYAAAAPTAIALAIFRPRRRPAAVLFLAALLYTLSQVSLSMDAVLDNFGNMLHGGILEREGTRAFPWGFLLLLGGALVAWHQARRSPRGRCAADATAIIAIGTLATMVGIGIVKEIPLPFRYTSAALGALALLGGGAVSQLSSLPTLARIQARTRGVLPPLLFLGSMAMVASSGPASEIGPSRRLTFQELVDLAPSLEARGITSYDEAICRIRGPYLPDILIGFSVLPSFRPPEELPSTPCSPSALSRPLWGNLRDNRLTLTPYSTMLKWDEAEICLMDDDMDCRFTKVDLRNRRLLGSGYPSLIETPSSRPKRLRLRVPSFPDLPEDWPVVPVCPGRVDCFTRVSRPDTRGGDFVVEWTLNGKFEQHGILLPPVWEGSAGPHEPYTAAGTQTPDSDRMEAEPKDPGSDPTGRSEAPPSEHQPSVVSHLSPPILPAAAGPIILAAAEAAGRETGIHVEDVGLRPDCVDLRVREGDQWRELRLVLPSQGDGRRFLALDGPATSRTITTFAATMDHALSEDPWKRPQTKSAPFLLQEVESPDLPPAAARALRRLHPAAFPWLSYCSHWLLMLMVLCSLACSLRKPWAGVMQTSW